MTISKNAYFKHGLFLLLTLFFTQISSFAQNKSDIGKLFNYQLFNQVKPTQALKDNLDTACTSYSVAEFNTDFRNILFQERPTQLDFIIPTTDGKLFAQVTAVNVVSSDFVLQEWANGVTTTRNFEAGLYFRGKLKNDPTSTVAISFFENGQIMGVVFSKKWSGNLVIGLAKTVSTIPFSERPILIYNDNQLQRKNNFRCNTPDSPLPDMGIPESIPETPQGLPQISCKVVRIYLEAGTTVYTSQGSSVTATTNYVTGLMNVISAVYDNEQIAIIISRLQVNSTDDGVPLATSTTVLNSFSTRMGTTTTFTEPIGHYLTARRSLGGLAYLDILCSSRSFRTGMSDIDDNYSLLPTYSWSVNVMSHELGHNLGSNHTQWCGWQITPTIRKQIDSCYTAEAATGGTCYNGANVGRVGTIMSYCHLTGSVDLALGFGTLPGARIRNTLANSFCIATANIPPPTITASGSVSICNGDSVTLTATGGLKYIWSNGATTSSIIVKTAGRYSVNALLGTCRSNESNLIDVSVVTAPTIPIITNSQSTNLCSGESVVLTSSISTGNQWFKNGTLLTGATSGTLTVNTAGSYQVRQGPNTNNCFSISLPKQVNVGFIDRTNSATTSVNNICSGTVAQLRSNRTIGAQVLVNNNNRVSISNSGTPTVQSVINIPNNYTFTTQDTLIIGVNASHTFLADLTLTLISPSGTRVVLFNRLGGSADNFTNTQFSNFRGTPLGTGVAPFTGIFTPVNSFTVFNNQNISGNWTLEIADGANDDGGELINWSFQLKSRSLFSGFRWSVLNGALLDSAATMNVTPNSTTSYVLTKTSFSGCIDKDTLTIFINNLAGPTITAGGSTTFCVGGSVVLTSSALSGNLWSNGSTTRSITVSTGGSYTVRQIVGTCTSASSTAVVVTANPLPTVNIIVEGSTTFCIATGVGLRANTGNGTTFNYQWFRNSAVIPSATAVNFTATSSGNYTVRAINENACTTLSSAVVLTGVSNPVTPTISGISTYCAGGSTVLTSSAALGNIWSNGATSQSITVSNAGSYTVRSVVGTCTSAVSNSIGVTEIPLPTTPTISGSASFCRGASTVLTSSAALGNIWSNGATSQSITVSNAGSYTVRSVVGTCTSAVSSAFGVTETPLPTTPIITGSATFCQGESTVLTSSAALGNIWSNGATSQSITVSNAGSYTVRSVVGTCTSAVSNSISVTEISLPTTPTISGSASFCRGGSTVLSSSAALGNVWSNGATSQSITVSNAGSYTVRLVVGTCTSAVSSAFGVTETPLPTTPTISGSATFCQGESTVLTSSAALGNVWSNGATSQSITVSNAGSYTVRLVVGTCTSAVSSAFGVTETPLPTTPTITGSATFCQGESTVLTSSVALGNVWSNGATSQSITVSNAGSYTVRSVVGICTSAVSSAFGVTETLLPTTPIITGSATFCQGESTVLTSSVALGNIWSNGATSQSITVSNAGSYTVRSVVGTCTSAVSSAFGVTETPLPTTPIITGSATFCQGESTVLTSSAALGNIWSNGATSQSITVSNAGSYTVRSVVGTCTSAVSTAFGVTEIPLPTIPTITGSVTFCQGESTVLTSSAALGNVWSNGATSQSITVSNAGSYTVRSVVGICTSAVSSAFGVTETPLPTTPIITGSATFCQGESTVLTSSAALGNIWSNGATSQSITVSNAGSYTVRTVVGTCTSAVSSAFGVTETPLPTTPIITGSATFCQGESTVLTSSAALGNIWSNGATSQSITVSNAGNYTVRTVVGTCTSAVSSIFGVTETPLPITPTITGSASFCQGESTVLTSSAALGNVWSNGATSQSITVSNAGSYTVRSVVGTCTSAASSAFGVTEISLIRPQVAVSAINIVIGDSAILTIVNPNTGSDYLWSNGIIATRLAVRTDDTLTVQERLNGCLSASSLPIIITNGKAKYNSTLAVVLYPNPAMNAVNVSTVEPIALQFYSAEGKIVKRFTLETSGSIDLTGLASGLYQVIITSSGGQSATKLMVK